MKTIRNIAIGFVVLLLIILQLGLGSSWSWVVSILEVLTALVTFRAAGMSAAYVVLKLPNPRIWLTLLHRIVSIIVLVFANVNTAAFTPMALFAIGLMGPLLEHYKLIDIRSTCPRVLSIMAIKAVVTTVLVVLMKPSIPWSWVVTTTEIIKVSVALAVIGHAATTISKSLPLDSYIFRICVGMTSVPLNIVGTLSSPMFVEVCVFCREILALILFFRHIMLHYFF